MFMQQQTQRWLCMMNLKGQWRTYFSFRFSAGSIILKLILCIL
jgi:hypothetical protein